MKRVILLVFVMPFMAYGQIVENFESGNVNNWLQSTEDRWKADTAESISGRFSLHHIFDNPDAGTDRIGISVRNLHPSEGLTRWSFLLRHGYDPSSLNNWSVFLMSDAEPDALFQDETDNGFALGVNMTGFDDTLRLCKVKGNSVTPFINCRINWQTEIGTADAVKIIVERTPGGNWSVTINRFNGDLITSASGSDSELFRCDWFGICYRYSSSRDRLLWFDDLRIDGIFYEDNEIPVNPVLPETGDVVISEIMADPEAVVSLPAREYLEITNRTESPFNLKNWKLTSGDQDYIFPEVTIKPYGIMIICSAQDTSKFSRYGKVLGLKQFPTLTDNGKIILLCDASDKLIHGVEYFSEWYRDELKSKGGWSLEMVDTGYPFYFGGNWIASESRNGGTPGSVNSVAGNNPDNSFSGVINVFPEDSLTITVRFSEPVLNLSGMVNSLNVDGKSSADIFPIDPLFRVFTVKPGDALLRGDLYQLNISEGIKDFAGNRILKDNYTFGLTESPEPGDILFNELLLNALPGDPDYLEFYNISEKILDALRLQVVSVNDVTGDTSLISVLSDERRCILSGSYYAVTTGRDGVIDRYFSTDPDYLVEVGSLPSMPDDKGHLILYNRELERIDEVFYNENMQSKLLSGFDGVALEKINPLNKSGDAMNWHSASESSGWGTPGAPNSVFAELPVTSDRISFSSSKITPDDDGFEDILMIGFNLTGSSNVISAMVFDETGSYIRKIVSNMYAGQEASLIWDGTADDGSMVNTGIYIVFITLYDDTGKTEKWKKVCTVIRN